MCFSKSFSSLKKRISCCASEVYISWKLGRKDQKGGEQEKKNLLEENEVVRRKMTKELLNSCEVGRGFGKLDSILFLLHLVEDFLELLDLLGLCALHFIQFQNQEKII